MTLNRRLVIFTLLVTGAGALGVGWVIKDPLAPWEAGGRQLRAGLKEALHDRAGLAFSQAGDELRYRYPGDPRKVLRGLESCLEAPDDTSRFLVARLFLQCGFEPGKAGAALLEMVRRVEAVPGGLDGTGLADLRPVAAELLAFYRNPGAVEGIRSLYESTGDRGLLKPLARLGERRALEASATGDLSRLEDKEWIPIFGEWKVEQTRRSMEEIYHRPANPAIARDRDAQIDLAGALYQLTGEREYLDFLVAQRLHERATRYLSKLEGDAVRPILESQLYAQDLRPQNAVFLGLFRNHRDSPVVKKYILEWFDLRTTPRPTVDEEVLFRVALRMNDPQIEAAAIRFSRDASRDLWKFWGFRKDWPLEDLDR